MSKEEKAKLTHGSLFPGIGGFELGAEWSNIETKWNCEIEQFNRDKLKQLFQNAKQYPDIRRLSYPETVDIVSGGILKLPYRRVRSFCIKTWVRLNHKRYDSQLPF